MQLLLIMCFVRCFRASYIDTAVQQNASAEVTSLRMASLRPWQGSRSYVMILEPLNINATYSKTLENNAQLVCVDFEAIDMT